MIKILVNLLLTLAFYAVPTKSFTLNYARSPFRLGSRTTMSPCEVLLRREGRSIAVPGTFAPRHKTLHLRPFSERKTVKLSSSSFSSAVVQLDSKKRRKQQQPTMVYALILGSMASFIMDNVLHLNVFKSFYLYHRKWNWWQLITSTFCHADRSHLSGNIFLLLLFGRSVEDELGSSGLLFSYLFCGVVANLCSLFLLPRNTISIGASGAVYGLFAVSIVSRLGDVFRDWRKFVEVSVVGQFVISRVFEEAKTAVRGGIAGVNHVAHLSGAGAGVLMIVLLQAMTAILEQKNTNSNTILQQ